MTAHTTDPLEDLLAAALSQARTDERWAVAPRPHTAAAVKRAATRQRARSAGFALAGVAVAAGGAVALGTGATGALGEVSIQQPAAPGSPQASPEPVPGISPAWAPTTGREWVLSRADYEAFEASHRLPSPAPHDVPSPAPLTEMSAQLQREAAAVLPAGTTVARQDALNGQRGTAGLDGRLPDGTPFAVSRIPLQNPISWEISDGSRTPRATLRDLSTGSVLVTIPGVGYGWPGDIPDGANMAWVVTARGVQTAWYAPSSVPLSTVAQWAEQAELAAQEGRG